MAIDVSANHTRMLRWGTVAALSVHLLSLLFLGLAQLPPSGYNVIRDGIILLLPLLTLPMAFRPKSRFSRLMGLLTVLGAAGQIVWIVEKHGFDRWTEPSWATPFWLGGYLLVVGLLCIWPARIERKPSLRHTLDSAIVWTGLLALAWVYLLGPRLLGRSITPAFALDAAYVMIDVAAFIALVQAVRRGLDPRFRRTTIFALAGLACLGLSDAMEAMSLTTSGWLQNLTSLAWPLGATFGNLAAYAHGIESQQPKLADSVRPRFEWRLWMPYLALLPVAALLIRVASDPELHRLELGVKICAIVLTAALGLRQYVAIRENEQLVGELAAANKAIEAKNEEVERANEDLTDVLNRLMAKNQELEMANQQLAQLVTVDGMTGLGNHRAFHERLRLEVEAAHRFGHPLVVVIADVDHFRRYNDEFGHPAGDEVLRQVAKTLFDEIDLKAYPARFGGEEFGLVMPYVTSEEAHHVAERIGRAVAAKVQAKRPITLSFGVAGVQGNQWSAEILVQEALRALEAAKARGRNQIVLADDLGRRILDLGGSHDTDHVFDPTEPMGLAAVISAGLRAHPQALSMEPESQLVSGLLGTLELKDLETRDHSERVMWYALRLAQSVIETRVAKMTQQDLRSLAYGALLHDIGKIGVPEAILKFPGKLTEEMKNIVREHPRLGAQLVQKFPSLELALSVVRCHHERWDGGGYPAGVAGREIPLVARIFALVDALEALTSQRPYKDPVPIETVTEILVRDSGTHFDPAIVDAYLAVPMAEWMRLREQERYIAGAASSGWTALPPAA